MALTTDKKARKNAPMDRGLLAYFPNALAGVAELSRIGNEQHNPGEEMHWARDKSKDHGDCIIRHQADFDQLDEDGIPHAAKVAWRALAQYEEYLIARGATPGRGTHTSQEEVKEITEEPKWEPREGDKVRVKKHFDSPFGWESDMNRMVGRTYTITRVSPNYAVGRTAIYLRGSAAQEWIWHKDGLELVKRAEG